MVSVGSILHICSDYAHQHLYRQLIEALHAASIVQSVYVPVRTAAAVSAARPSGDSITFHARHVLRPAHRLLFRTKVRAVTADLLQVENPKRFSLLHAHFLYSDGAVALRLHEEDGLPFIAAVRNTDLNAFMRLRPDLTWVMHRIVRAASALVFLSPTYRDQFLERLPQSLRRTCVSKCVVIPNGLNPAWFEPLTFQAPRMDRETLRILYVGDFSTNKNVIRLIEATKCVSVSRPVSLTLVGGGGQGSGATNAGVVAALKRFPWLRVLGRIDDPLELRAVYREHDIFAMPSFRETFGLVYVEAWSQGLPVVLSQGQGVDGYFPSGTIAETADPKSVNSIAQAILAAAASIGPKREACISAAQAFSWSKVAAEYRKLYGSITQNVEEL
jgi:glycosyltransferase involved in cell wall biosynthesis